MPTYSVQCVNRSSGQSSIREVEAIHEDDAREQLAAEGLITGAIKPITVSRPQTSVVNAQGVEDSVNLLRAYLAEATTFRRLERTIARAVASGVVMGGIVLIVLSVLLGIGITVYIESIRSSSY